MSVRFVHTGDKKYVQYRLKSTKFNTLEYNWQNLNDIESEDSSLDADLLIEDANGGAVVEFANGHIRTKEFDSRHIVKSEESGYNADLLIEDKNGNAVVEFAGGHIRTKEFDSRNIIPVSEMPLRGLKLSILGDSISTFQGKLVPNNIGLYAYYPQGDVINWTDTYWGKLCNEDGMILEANCASNGSTVAGNTDFAFSSDARLSLLGNPDIIIFYGGTNDFSSATPIGTFNYDGNYSSKTTEFKSAYAYCLYKMKTLCPSAKIVCVLLPDYYSSLNPISSTVYPIKNSIDKFNFEYNNTIKELAAAYKCKVCDISSVLPYYNRDNLYIHDASGSRVHPTKASMAKIYNVIKQSIIEII